MASERILVVANSRKGGGRCLAGVHLEQPRLIRPVSPVGRGGALSDDECKVAGHTPRLLEIVRFTHDGEEGEPTQPENLVIDGTPWRTEGPAERGGALDALMRVVEEGPKLFGNRGRAVAEHVAAAGMDSSLAVIAPEALRFGHGADAEAHKGSPRAVFELDSEAWSLPITDFELGPKILQLPEGLYEWEDLDLREPERVLLTISLGTAYDGWHFKLVAGVLCFA